MSEEQKSGVSKNQLSESTYLLTVKKLDLDVDWLDVYPASRDIDPEGYFSQR